MIVDNVNALRSRIQAVCGRTGRNFDDITVLAVAKTFGADCIREAVKAGLEDIGENYVQEMNAKRSELLDLPIRWHFIGHLQTNKVRQILDTVHLIHSVDNIKLAREIDKRAGKAIEVLVEVHTTDEATKFGSNPSETVDLVRQISRLPHVRVRGLMTMGPFSDNPDDSRPSFRIVKELAGDIEREGIENVTMKTFSMGMSHDYEVAIEEGATIIRIGTVIFGKRTKVKSEV